MISALSQTQQQKLVRQQKINVTTTAGTDTSRIGARPPIPGSEDGSRVFLELSNSSNNSSGVIGVGTGSSDTSLHMGQTHIPTDFANSSVNSLKMSTALDSKSSIGVDSCSRGNNNNNSNNNNIGCGVSNRTEETQPQRSAAAARAFEQRGFEPEGSADITPPFSESNSNNSTPAYLRWAENLNNLLADPDGVELYKNYLKTENVGELLDFWFACQGLKKLPSDNTDKIFQLVKVINRKFLRSKVVPIAEATRKTIQDTIAGKSGSEAVQQDIFDAAQVEVEDRMTRTTYRNFLVSEAYLNYVQHMQIGESDLSAKCSGSQSTSSSISGRGPVQDDSGHFSVPMEIEKTKSLTRNASAHQQQTLQQNQQQQLSQQVGADTTSDSTSGISESSSGMNQHLHHPHNNTQQPNTSVDEPSDSGGSQMVQSMSALPTLHENSELDLTDDKSMSASLLGLTSQSLIITQRRRHVVKPEAQAGVYLQSGRVPHPYHAYSSAYNPVSRQDSELQSLSSDAHTTDDNMSSFTESSSHYSYRQITSKKHIRRQLRRAQEQSRHNRENTQASHSQQAFIPRTARMPAEASNQLPPPEFAALLIQKLDKVKREQELNEKLNRKLAEDTHSLVSQDSSRSLADMLREKLVLPDESDQSILDEHVSRIWTDKTPLRSPGDPTGRPRSPGGGAYRGKSGSGQLSTSMGAMAPHRTLPGRGHRSQTRRMPGQQIYHQDLAYYDRMSGSRPDLPPPRTASAAAGAARLLDSGGPPGTTGGVDPCRTLEGNTNRVMEWMQDVERQSGGVSGVTQAAGQDQRSQSSRGANKTSPRSSRPKTSHRSQSQERMSTSWAGHGGHPGHLPNQFSYQASQQTPMQLEETKRRLMMVDRHHHGLPGLPTNTAVPTAAVAAAMQQQQQQMQLHQQQQQNSMSHMAAGINQSNNSTLRKGPKSTSTETTVAVYTFSHEREPMPYRIKIPSKAVTLKAVKDLLPKKGAFRFYFKTEIDGEACYEEETDDSNLVPLWEGKVLVQCRIMD